MPAYDPYYDLKPQGLGERLLNLLEEQAQPLPQEDHFEEHCEALREMGFWVPEEPEPGPKLWLPQRLRKKKKPLVLEGATPLPASRRAMPEQLQP